MHFPLSCNTKMYSNQNIWRLIQSFEEQDFFDQWDFILGGITEHGTKATKTADSARLEARPRKMFIVCVFVVVFVTVFLNVLVCFKCFSFYSTCSFQPLYHINVNLQNASPTDQMAWMKVEVTHQIKKNHQGLANQQGLANHQVPVTHQIQETRQVLTTLQVPGTRLGPEVLQVLAVLQVPGTHQAPGSHQDPEAHQRAALKLQRKTKELKMKRTSQLKLASVQAVKNKAHRLRRQLLVRDVWSYTE